MAEYEKAERNRTAILKLKRAASSKMAAPFLCLSSITSVPIELIASRKGARLRLTHDARARSSSAKGLFKSMASPT